MFLKETRKTYKGKKYVTYALTESYRENGKVKHRNIKNLGPLTEEQAQRIRLVLKAQNIEDAFVGHLSDVVSKDHFRFLDIAVLDDLWRQFNLNRFFDELPYAEAMVVNRCLEPKSKIRIQHWAHQTVLPRLLSYNFDEENEYAIYRTLDKIADQEKELQQYIYEKYKQFGHADEKAFFYDITSSYFEGTKCILAVHGYSRDHRPDRLQITIALVVTPKGYPFYWQVMPGNTQDITTVTDLLTILKNRFDIRECLLVFDRGMVSQDNLAAIANSKLTYVSALDKDEIPGLGLLPSGVQDLVIHENWKKNLMSIGFSCYDENLLYRECAKEDDKRYILTFDRKVYEEQQQSRQERLQKALNFLTACNEELKQAQKSRNNETVTRKIEKQLRKWKLNKVITFQLEPITISVTTNKGRQRKVSSFQIVHSIDETKLKQQTQLDGVTCFVSNQAKDKLSAEQVILYYRRKNKVEEAFREIKDYIQLRPFYLSRKKRVRAHVSICVLGYLLLNAMEDRLRQHQDSPSPVDALEILSKCLLNRLGLKKSKTYTESITEVKQQQQDILENLGLKHLISKKYLNDILAHSAM